MHLDDIVEVVRGQIESAELLLAILKDKSVRKYAMEMQVEWVSEKQIL